MDFLVEQKLICTKYNVDWIPSDLELKLGLSDGVLNGLLPIHGLRHSEKNGTTGWYIWAGQEFSEDVDFFKPYCVKHLIDLKPEIVKYLGLPPGFRFLIDEKGFEDVWEDRKLIE